MGSKFPPTLDDTAFDDTTPRLREDNRSAGRPVAILEPTGAVMQMTAAMGGTMPADDPVGRFIWDLPLWDEATRELLRSHVGAIADGSEAPQGFRVQPPAAVWPTDLTLRPIQADNGHVGAIILETMPLAGAPSDPREMVPREFVEDMAHELNNALASVLGNLELIERRSQDNAAVMARIPRAREALDRAFTLIQCMRK